MVLLQALERVLIPSTWSGLWFCLVKVGSGLGIGIRFGLRLGLGLGLARARPRATARARATHERRCQMRRRSPLDTTVALPAPVSRYE